MSISISCITSVKDVSHWDFKLPGYILSTSGFTTTKIVGCGFIPQLVGGAIAPPIDLRTAMLLPIVTYHISLKLMAQAFITYTVFLHQALN